MLTFSIIARDRGIININITARQRVRFIDASCTVISNSTVITMPNKATQYPECPQVDSGARVEPTLAGYAHEIHVPPPPIDSEYMTGRLFLGPQQAAREAVLDELQSIPIVGIVNCTLSFPNRFQNDGIASTSMFPYTTCMEVT